MKRRTAILFTGVGLVGAGAFLRTATSSDAVNNEHTKSGTDTNNKIMADLNLDPHPETITPLTLSPEEWKERLSDQAFYVLREEGTERPFTSELNDEKRAGETWHIN